MYISPRMRKQLTYVAIGLLSASLFTACSGMHVSGGIAGSILSMLGIIVLVFTLSTTQTGCPAPCLQPGPPDSSVGPCLSPIPDAGPDKAPDGTVGPCLSIDRVPPRDESKVEPCLGAPIPEENKQGFLAPHPNQPESGVKLAAAEREHARNDAIARLRQRGVLPPDVAKRLKGKS